MSVPADRRESGLIPLVVFDDGKGQFGPLTDLRAAFQLRAGLSTILERIESAIGREAAALMVDPGVETLVAESTGRAVNAVPSADACLVVNGRLLDLSVMARISALKIGESLVDADGTLVAAVAPRAMVANLSRATWNSTATIEVSLANAPWDLTSRIGATLDEDLRMHSGHTVARSLRPDEGQSFGKHTIRIDPSARLGPFCVIDASNGPVIIGTDVVVRPLSVLVGPCAVLNGSIVSERALIKASTVIGPHCRVGGEVGGVIFQSYSNKSHDGHLGDSFVGEWVNIGAGTDNSNLLNTYGMVAEN